MTKTIRAAGIATDFIYFIDQDSLIERKTFKKTVETVSRVVYQNGKRTECLVMARELRED
jgi:hypothetical protein